MDFTSNCDDMSRYTTMLTQRLIIVVLYTLTIPRRLVAQERVLQHRVVLSHFVWYSDRDILLHMCFSCFPLLRLCYPSHVVGYPETMLHHMCACHVVGYPETTLHHMCGYRVSRHSCHVAANILHLVLRGPQIMFQTYEIWLSSSLFYHVHLASLSRRINHIKVSWTRMCIWVIFNNTQGHQNHIFEVSHRFLQQSFAARACLVHDKSYLESWQGKKIKLNGHWCEILLVTILCDIRIVAWMQQAPYYL